MSSRRRPCAKRGRDQAGTHAPLLRSLAGRNQYALQQGGQHGRTARRHAPHPIAAAPSVVSGTTAPRCPVLPSGRCRRRLPSQARHSKACNAGLQVWVSPPCRGSGGRVHAERVCASGTDGRYWARAAQAGARGQSRGVLHATVCMLRPDRLICPFLLAVMG
jgi:hypothetical protein